ncbi:hypothetical protein [Thalassolituus maritimus]|uniref:Uncharacterized protein n=1 Tax=Thalassolituus maritimus TaxID=484498 RepID=A0ABP9ZZD9_9GAMM
MAQGVVSDNWSLQDITSLFVHGLERDVASEIVVKGEEHSYNPISSAIIQTEALFDFISDLILRDEILVEENFTHAWEQVHSPILEAKSVGVVRAYPFLSEPEKIAAPREAIVNHICSTESLRISHRKNVDGWNANRCTPDPLLSATLWGGAGMCARSFVYEKSYTPHPLRKRLFLNSGFMLPSTDALHQLTTFLDDQKVKVIKKIYGNDSLYSAYINIPALPVRVIQEANSADQLISVALQMRDDFQSLRDWLKMFQNAISRDDTKTLLDYRKQLDSVNQYIDAKIGFGSKERPVTMEAGMGIFKIAMQGNPLENLKNQFGVRATLNKLVFGGSGSTELKKYVGMFGERGSEIGYEIERSFTKTP